MRCVLLVAIACAACGHAAGEGARPPPALPRLLPPPPLDPAARGAPYLTAVALQLQPGWQAFLDDCRLRLPPDHPLNRATLAATATLDVDRTGRVIAVQLDGSGNADFDRAVHDAIADASPLPPPPRELLSDDDRLHLRWLFARDRRQAGPATAAIVELELPLADAVARQLADGDLARAARRILQAPADGARARATERVMVAALREALASLDGEDGRAAVEAIGRAHVEALAPEVRARLAATSDTELRLAAVEAAIELDDRAAAVPLAAELPVDLPDHPQLAVAEARALAALGQVDAAASAIRAALDAHPDAPPPNALEAAAYAPIDGLIERLPGWFAHGAPATRAAACAALAGVPAPADAAWRWIARGLADPDATVRASCAAAAGARARSAAGPAGLGARLRALGRDRDATVRARAIAALAAFDPRHPVRAASDAAPAVRVAYAQALAAAPDDVADAGLATLLADRDPEVRAAAWTAVAAAHRSVAAGRAAQAAVDPSAHVRAAAVAVLDEAALAHLAEADDTPGVRTAALVELTARRGRAASTPALLAALAAAPPRSAERVRTALAWLLAR